MKLKLILPVLSSIKRIVMARAGADPFKINGI